MSLSNINDLDRDLNEVQTLNCPANDIAESSPTVSETTDSSENNTLTAEEPAAEEPPCAVPAAPEPEPPQTPAPKKAVQQKTRAELDLEFVEKAAFVEEYCTYDREEIGLPADAAVTVYAARRIGLGHIAKGVACQDFCLYRKIRHGVALLDADGVSACERSDFGSEMVCRIAADHIEELSSQVEDEKQFVQQLCTDEFYTSLRDAWVACMKADWLTIPDRDPAGNPLELYGTTLLIAVVTDNWYVTLNLGDGQIIMFNEHEAQRLQLIGKTSQAPSCLIYPNYLESLQRGIWPRKDYRGIMIFTDGINDKINELPWYAIQDYVNQCTERFAQHQAPYQPFIYTGTIHSAFDGRAEVRTIDLSRQRNATDDFSFVMAVNEDYRPDDTCISQIREHLPDATGVRLQRRIGRKASYQLNFPRGDSKYVLVVPEEDMAVQRDPRFEGLLNDTVHLWNCKTSWCHNRLHYAVYEQPAKPMFFLEEGHQAALFSCVKQFSRSSRTLNPRIGEPIIKTQLMLCGLVDHLAAQGLRLNEMAYSWIVQEDNDTCALWIPPELLTESDQTPEDVLWHRTVEGLSPHMIGYLECNGQLMPLFDPYIVATEHYFFDAPNAEADEALAAEVENRFFSVEYSEKQKVHGMRNISTCEWTLHRPDNTTVKVSPKTAVALRNGVRIEVAPPDKAAFVCTVVML